MQQHSGQHLLSATLIEMFGAVTVSFHLGQDSSAIDLAVPTLSPEQSAQAELRANAIVGENRAVTVSYATAAEAANLRKPSEREGLLRIVTIDGLDHSACGGTHVRRTGEIGPILLRKTEKIRGNVRLEFLCGIRAIRRARADYDALARIGRALSSGLDDAPDGVAALIEKAQDLERSRRKLAIELAERKGRELYASGERTLTERVSGAIGDEQRVLAQSFCAGSGARYLAISEDPPSLLLCVSKDSATHAGNAVKAALAAEGGRGGGNAQIAQGSAPTREALARAIAVL
jgi:alanyl-tRNA synthetase